MDAKSAFRQLINRAIPLRARNSIRVALNRHPIEYRLRWPDLSMFRLAKNDVIFDVGANVGDFIECVLAYQPWAVIHAFEPLPDIFDILCAKFKDYSGIHCHNVALGSAPHEAILKRNNFHEASSFLENGRLLTKMVYGIDFTVKEAIKTPVETVARYVSVNGLSNIKLLKLDVQGYEIEILKGAESVLDKIEYVYAEAQFQELYRNGPLYTDIFEYLSQRNFELLRMTAFRVDDDGKLMECDMIFRNKGTRGN